MAPAAVEMEGPVVALRVRQRPADEEIADRLGVPAGLTPRVRLPALEGLGRLARRRIAHVQSSPIGNYRLEGYAVGVRRRLEGGGLEARDEIVERPVPVLEDPRFEAGDAVDRHADRPGEIAGRDRRL